MTLVDVRVTTFELRERGAWRPPPPVGFPYALMRTRKIPPHFFRYLYRTIGQPWHWSAFRDLDDDALSSILHRDDHTISVLYVEGVPAGFFQIDRSEPPMAFLSSFGIIPDFSGRGLGSWLLAAALDDAWTKDTELVRLKTSSLAHPAAFVLYQKAGFVPVEQSAETIEPWDD